MFESGGVFRFASDNVPYLFWATNEQCGLNYIYGKIIRASLIKKQTKQKNIKLYSHDFKYGFKNHTEEKFNGQKPFSSILERKKNPRKQ